MNRIQLPLYIQNSSEYKVFLAELSTRYIKYQNGFASRKRQTQKFASWLAYNKNLVKTKVIWENDEMFLDAQGVDKLVSKVYNCLSYKQDGLSIHKGSSRIRCLKWNYCNEFKLCANCAKIKAYRNQVKFLSYLEKRPDLLKKNWYHMTLTIKNQIFDDFDKLYNHLNNSIQKLHQKVRDSKRGKNKSSVFRHIEWAILSIEFTYWKNGWHPHVHILFCSDHLYGLEDKYNTQTSRFTQWNEEISTARLAITWDSYISSIVVTKPLWEHEVFKYITKFSTLPDEKRLELYSKTVRFRFLRKWGVLYQAPIDEETLEAEVREKFEALLPSIFDNSTGFYSINTTQLVELNHEASLKDWTNDLISQVLNEILLGNHFRSEIIDNFSTTPFHKEIKLQKLIDEQPLLF